MRPTSFTEMFDQGHSIHRSFEKYLLGTFTADLDLTPETVGFWESSKEVIQRIKLPAGFEIKVNHPALSYSGYIDCIAEVEYVYYIFVCTTHLFSGVCT